jgi:murein DD-endopeptidase MepM/ murein hydrolase activator NlpD
MNMKVTEAAQDLEAYFIRQMLAEVKVGEGSLIDGGFEASTFKEMFNDAIAKEMSKTGGVGIAQMLEKELQAVSGSSLPITDRGMAPVLPLRKAHTAYQSVVDGVQSSGFGARRDPISGEHKHHHGVDIAAERGEPVKAASAGTVIRAEASGNYGNLVVVDHGDGVETRYAHLEEIKVQPGDRLEAGQALGTVGDSGRATGTHLHFEVRKDGQAIDPSRSGLKLLR